METRKAWSKELDEIWKIEEIKAWQRAKEKEIKEGDWSTSYFFALANYKKRKKEISCLEDNRVSL
jgi:hypothetical protein